MVAPQSRSARRPPGGFHGARRHLARALLLFVAATLQAQVPPAECLSRFEFVKPHMGALFRLVFFAANAEEARSAASAAFARVAELNRVLSDYDPESEISRIARHPPGTAVAASPDLFVILERSREITGQSHGAFDVTLGPLVGLWRETRRTGRLPAEAERATALRACGARNLRLDPIDRTVTLLAPGMRFDFGGIAKGFAADEALAVLASRGISRAMVAASGDLALGDAPPGTRGWKVDLAPFGASSSEPLRIVAANVGISTSGDAEQFVVIDGIRYSHILNPATGLGLTKPIAVTIVAPDATQSDGWATACTVLSDRGAIAACMPESVRALVFRREESGVVRRENFGRSPPGLKSEP